MWSMSSVLPTTSFARETRSSSRSYAFGQADDLAIPDEHPLPSIEEEPVEPHDVVRRGRHGELFFERDDCSRSRLDTPPHDVVS